MAICEVANDKAFRQSVAARARALTHTKLYDLLAAAPLIAWYAFLLSVQIPPLAAEIAALDPATADAGVLAGIAAKLATLAFLAAAALLLALRHVPLRKASGFFPRFAAVAGTFLSGAIVQLPPRELPLVLQVGSTLLILGGIALALYATLGLGRSLSMMPEARKLVTSGPYRVVRHPLYLGEAVSLVGVTLQFLSAWAVALMVLQWLFQLQRMKNEELVLSRTFPDYRDYQARTARLLPGLY